MSGEIDYIRIIEGVQTILKPQFDLLLTQNTEIKSDVKRLSIISHDPEKCPNNGRISILEEWQRGIATEKKEKLKTKKEYWKDVGLKALNTVLTIIGTLVIVWLSGVLFAKK